MVSLKTGSVYIKKESSSLAIIQQLDRIKHLRIKPPFWFQYLTAITGRKCCVSFSNKHNSKCNGFCGLLTLDVCVGL